VFEAETGWGEFEVIEGESPLEDETLMGRRHEWTWSQGDKGGSGIAGLGFESMPEIAGDLPEFAFADEVQIEEDEREVSVSQQKVGTLEGLLGLVAADPDELAAALIGVGRGVESVAAIDEGEGEVARLLQKF